MLSMTCAKNQLLLIRNGYKYKILLLQPNNVYKNLLMKRIQVAKISEIIRKHFVNQQIPLKAGRSSAALSWPEFE